MHGRKRIVSEYFAGTVRTAWTFGKRRGKSETLEKDVNLHDANNIGNVLSQASQADNKKIEMPKQQLEQAPCIARRTKQSQSLQMPVIVPFPEVITFVERCMLAVGTKAEHGNQLAEVLIDADYRGHFSHGIKTLETYVNEISSKTTLCSKEPIVLSEKAASAYVDGQNLLGPVVGNFSMQLAIKKAKQAGIGWVTAKASNNYGIAAYYSKQACKVGLLGLSFTNTSPQQVVTRGKKPVLGTNPMSLSAPGDGGDGFLLDMATSGIDLETVELHKTMDVKLAKGLAVDGNGVMTDDPNVVLKEGALLPLGGDEIHSGYKGYGLAMLVEIFCGILGNANYGTNIRSSNTGKTPENLGQCFIAIDPDAFASGFKSRLQHFVGLLRASEPIECDWPILVPGDPELRHMEYCTQLCGIPYHPNLISLMETLAKRLSVDPLKTKQSRTSCKVASKYNRKPDRPIQQ